jgi:predicted transposase YdaD
VSILQAILRALSAHRGAGDDERDRAETENALLDNSAAIERLERASRRIPEVQNRLRLSIETVRSTTELARNAPIDEIAHLIHGMRSSGHGRRG